MYQPPRQDEERPGCRDVWVLSRATFAVVLWPLAAIACVLGAVFLAFVLVGVHPALGALPVLALVAGIYLFARWERRRAPEE
jgi:hypothetical protein